jgi:hypothetical protein
LPLSWFKLRPFGLDGLILLLVGANVFIWFVVPLFRFQSIVIHHTASTVDDYASIKRYQHKKNGWQDAAYHLILSNGRAGVPLGHLEATNRYRWLAHSLGTRSSYHNLTGVHLCIVGNFETGSFPANLRAPLAHAIRLLQDRYWINKNKILFHKDCSGTKCPGRNLKKARVKEWVAGLADSCPPETRAQQRKIVGQAMFSIHTLPAWALVAMGGASLFVLALWLIIRRRTKPESESTPDRSLDEVSESASDDGPEEADPPSSS